MSSYPRIGLLGCGAVATYGHLPAIAATPGLNLVSVFDPDPARIAKAVADHPHVRGFTDEEAFFNSGLDAVTITSPAGVHLANVRSAARHGLPVLCEKPLAAEPDEAREMVALMKAAKLPLHLGFCYRFSPAALEIKALIARGEIGTLRSLRLIYLWTLHGQFSKNAAGEKIPNERRNRRMDEGGPMIDCGVHQIDLARWWTGSPVVAQTGRGAWVEDFRAPDHVWLHLDHASGAHTHVEMSFTYGHTLPQPYPIFTYELIGTDGIIRYDRATSRFELRNSKGVRELPWANEKNFEGLYAAWARFLITGSSPDLPTGEDGVIATDIAMAGTDEAIDHRASLLAAKA